MEALELFSKHKNKIVNIGVIILALIIANNIYKKQLSSIESLREKKEMELKINNVLGEISIMNKKLDAYNKLLALKDTGVALNTISSLAKDSNIKITSIKPSAEQRFSEYIKYPFDLNVTASDYHSLARFISKIENSREVYLVDGLDIRFNKEQKELSGTLKISAIAATN